MNEPRLNTAENRVREEVCEYQLDTNDLNKIFDDTEPENIYL